MICLFGENEKYNKLKKMSVEFHSNEPSIEALQEANKILNIIANQYIDENNYDSDAA